MDHFYEQFGAKIRLARVQAGLSQEELGRRVGLTRSSISNVEKGRQHSLAHMVIEFATALGIAPIDLLPNRPAPADPLRGVPDDARAFVEDVLSTAEQDARG